MGSDKPEGGVMKEKGGGYKYQLKSEYFYL